MPTTTENTMTASPRILMCPPEFYGIEYEINPWMDRRRQADHELAVRQWTELHAILETHGAEISCMTPVKGLPDLVFTANAGLDLPQHWRFLPGSAIRNDSRRRPTTGSGSRSTVSRSAR